MEAAISRPSEQWNFGWRQRSAGYAKKLVVCREATKPLRPDMLASQWRIGALPPHSGGRPISTDRRAPQADLWMQNDGNLAPDRTLADSCAGRRRSLRNETRSWAQSGPNAFGTWARTAHHAMPGSRGPRSSRHAGREPPIWGSRGCKFKSLQPDNKIRLGRQDCHGSGARPISEYCGPSRRGCVTLTCGQGVDHRRHPSVACVAS
jgi:hypothetical protein